MRLGVIPSNTQGFPVFMKSVSKTVDFSALRWWSITLQESFSKQFSILHYLLHALTLLSSISRATGEIFAIWWRHSYVVSKIPILPCSLGLWAFCFSFDNVFWNSCIHGFKSTTTTFICTIKKLKIKRSALVWNFLRY